MRELPIIFSGPMVRAIRYGTKTQTRRVIRPKPYYNDAGKLAWKCSGSFPAEEIAKHCPYGTVGSRLWVRETWCPLDKDAWWDRTQPWDMMYMMGTTPRRNGVAYLADSMRDGREDADSKRCRTELGYKWKPSIHMPRAASRIMLEVVSVRPERLQDISEEDAASEGVTCYHIDEPGRGWRDYSRPEGCEVCSAVDSFCTLWDSINSKRPGCSWADNPLVWRVEFKVVDGIGKD